MRYSFQFFKDGQEFRDVEVAEFETDEAAKEAAGRYLAEAASHIPVVDAIPRLGFEVTNEAGTSIATSGFTRQQAPELGSLARQLARGSEAWGR